MLPQECHRDISNGSRVNKQMDRQIATNSHYWKQYRLLLGDGSKPQHIEAGCDIIGTFTV